MPHSETSLTICAGRTLLSRAIGALLAELYPGVTIAYEDRSNPHDTVAVQLEGTSRWMCLLVRPEDTASARRALADDAWCLAVLSSSPEDFLAAADALIEGSAHHLPIALARSIASETSPLGQRADLEVPKNGHTPLTAREREVLAHVAAGLANAEVADAMGISIHTVRTHLSSMATKLEVSNRLRLVTKANLLGYDEAAHLPKAQ